LGASRFIASSSPVAMAKVTLKWGKEVYEVDVEDGETVEVFKTQVWTLTSVPVDKQTYLWPGGPLKESDNVAERASKLKPGAKVTLVGTAEAKQIQAPVERIVFEEDLSPEERAKIYKEKKVEVLPAGIKNLGNTCYMNSTLQCLFAVPDLQEAIMTHQSPAAGDRDIDSTLALQSKTVIQQLSASTAETPIVPMQFVMALRQRFPRFGEMQNGGYMQQDAEECLRGILEVLAGQLAGKGGGGNAIDDIFGFELGTTLKCLECDEEPPSQAADRQRLLFCHLGTQTDPVSHIHQGISLSLKEHIEKNSPVLARNAQYEKSSQLASLPPFLVVQFARFGYKGANEWAGTSAGKVKLIRRCAFNSGLDVFDICSPDLKKQLSAGRLEKKKQDDEQLERERKEKLAGSGPKDAPDAPAEAKPAEGDVDMKEPGDLEEIPTGQYELISIVSHKGRTADGGHYVGWKLHKKAASAKEDDKWILFDDEDVSWWNWKDMVGLSCDLQGGKADTQIAYMNIYRRQTVTVDKGHRLGSGDADAAPAPAAPAPES